MANAHAEPQHDYHLVNPESVAGDRLGLGLRRGRGSHHVDAPDGGYAPLIMGAGTIGIAYTMFGWWRDVIHEAEVEGDHTRVVQISHRYGMILFIASEVMFFVAWFWAYFNTALVPRRVSRRGADRLYRRRLAAQGRRDLRSVASAAPQHPDPSHLGHHGDLGAPRAARERSQGPDLGADLHHRARA